MELKTALT